MSAAPFHYHVPASMDEAVALLDRHGREARILAGGQSLMPAMAARLATPGHIIDINRLSRAERPAVTAGRLRIPPLVRHADCARLPVADPLAGLFAELAASVAPLPVRLRGTFCGAIANGDPASEWCLAAVVLGAEIVLRSQTLGSRVLPAGRFFQTVQTTAAEDNELVAEVQVPILPRSARTGSHKIARRTAGYGMALGLAAYDLERGVATDVRIGVGGICEVPRRSPAAERVLEGRPPGAHVFRLAAEAAADTVEPLATGGEDAAYQRDLAHAAVRRALEATL